MSEYGDLGPRRGGDRLPIHISGIEHHVVVDNSVIHGVVGRTADHPITAVIPVASAASARGLQDIRA